MSKLIKKCTGSQPETLEDLILAMSANIEQALIESGAVAGKDYKVLDLFNLAQPFALHVFSEKDSQVTFFTDWD